MSNYQKWKNMSNYNNIIIILAAVYIAERLELQGNFFEPQNPRFIIKKGYNSARTTHQIQISELNAKNWSSLNFL